MSLESYMANLSLRVSEPSNLVTQSSQSSQATGVGDGVGGGGGARGGGGVKEGETSFQVNAGDDSVMGLGESVGDSATDCIYCEFQVDVSDVVVVCERCRSRAHFDCVEGTDAFRLCAGHGWLCYTCCGTMRSCDECGEYEWSYNYCETCAAANLTTCSTEGCGKTLCQGGCHGGVAQQYVIECPICTGGVNFCCSLEEEGGGCCMTLHYEQAHGNKNKMSWMKMLGF